MPHGLANSIILPYALQQNSPAIGERMATLCKFLDIPNPSTESFIAYVLDLRKELGIPHTLVEADIPEERIEEIGEIAYRDPSTGSNAMPVTAKDFETLFTMCCHGAL